MKKSIICIAVIFLVFIICLSKNNFTSDIINNDFSKTQENLCDETSQYSSSNVGVQVVSDVKSYDDLFNNNFTSDIINNDLDKTQANLSDEISQCFSSEAEVQSAGVVRSYNGFLNSLGEYNPDKSVLIFTHEFDNALSKYLEIGMSAEEAKSFLGTPDLENSNGFLYYFEEYSLMLWGKDSIKYIGIISNPNINFNYDNFISDINENKIDIYDLRKKNGGYLEYSQGLYGVLLMTNGAVISQIKDESAIFLYKNPYIDWNKYNINNSEIVEEDFDFNSFMKFCEIMDSDDWVYNCNNSLAFYKMDNYQYNAGKIIVRDTENNIRVISTIYTPKQIEWISEYEIRFYTHTSLYQDYEEGPFIYNYLDDTNTLVD